ncbi:ceramidase domain-containing protein [Stappia sp.]|uniref:ceramidase domain-containing protein n=1 Tax=Stappia sp. TaxID=1870903 RepID=UPI003A99D893
MDWTRSVDAYCERLDPGLWAEPVNALTNAAFLVAAVAAWVAWRTDQRRKVPFTRPGDRAVPALIVILFLIGIGSFLFHTVATRWAALADVVPIAVFIHVYFYLAMRRILGRGVVVSLVLTVAFLVLGYGVAPVLSGVIGSSAGYVPAAIAILAVAVAARRLNRSAAGPLALIGAIFMISLAFRMADIPFCPSFPVGTHFVWHCLNAVVLYLLIRILIRANLRSSGTGPS